MTEHTPPSPAGEEDFIHPDGRKRCCAEDFGGSHYHCGGCGAVTGQLGHYKAVEWVNGRRRTMEGHQCCPNACTLPQAHLTPETYEPAEGATHDLAAYGKDAPDQVTVSVAVAPGDPSEFTPHSALPSENPPPSPLPQEKSVKESSLWEVLVPTVSNDGKPFRLRYHRVWDAKVKEITGGMTVVKPVLGTWVDDDGTEYKERMIPVRIMCSREEVILIGEMTKVYYDQLAVMIYKISDECLVF